VTPTQSKQFVKKITLPQLQLLARTNCHLLGGGSVFININLSCSGRLNSMTDFQPEDVMQSVEKVIQDSLRFKLKLDIGEDAYTSLKLKKHFLDSVDAATGATTGVAVAHSSLVASTFFTQSGLLGVLGIGATATPIGWAIAAGVAGAGLSIVIGKYFVRGSSGRVKSIPDFINTPLDILATGLFDMIAMLGVKLAAMDSNVNHQEREEMAIERVSTIFMTVNSFSTTVSEGAKAALKVP
jgi:hypothetical protein